jgi:hypothetical protein
MCLIQIGRERAGKGREGTKWQEISDVAEIDAFCSPGILPVDGQF